MKRITASWLTMIFSLSISWSQTVQWTTITSPTTNTLYGVAFSSPDTIIAVGDAGTIIRSTDSGFHWVSVSNPATDALRGVAFYGRTGIATGISGRTFRTTNGGENWTELTRFTHRDMFAVSMDKYMAVMTGHEGYIYRSRDGGQTWGFKNSGTFNNLFGVSVYGLNGVAASGQGAIVMTVDTARGFGLTILGQNPLDLLSFSAVSMANDTLGWVVGYLQSAGGIVIKTGDAGFVWKRVNVDTTIKLGALWGVAALSPDFCTIAGSEGKIYNTVDHGRNWTEQTTGTTQTLNAVAFANEKLGIAVGNGGTILKLGQGVATTVQETPMKGPLLMQNYPNPFRENTSIGFTLPAPTHTVLKIFNTDGELVNTLIDEDLPAGNHLAQYSGEKMTEGVYFYQLIAGSLNETRKMVLLK